MKKKLKIVTIGGGSSYTPELVEGFIKRYAELPVTEMWLVDIPEGEEKVNIVGALAKRMWKASGHPVEVHVTLNRRDALKDADFVTTQFRVGLLEARIKDERIPLSHGMLGQETNGAGGIFKAFRTIPVIGSIIQDMRELCPNAWLINFTNPSGMITEAAIRQLGWKKCIGLCNVPVISMMKEPAASGYNEKELDFRFAGLNHFHWHRAFTKDGQEVTQQLIKHINDKNGGTPKNIFQADFPSILLNRMHLVPCGYHRYYFLAQEMLEHSLQEFKKNDTRAEQVKEIETRLFEMYRNPKLTTKPEDLSKRGGAYYSDAACECISAIYNDKHEHMVVSTENRGALPDLPADSIVEISCEISARGAEPIAWGKLEAHERGWLQLMKAMEECTIGAALTGDYGLAYEAFTLNPLVMNNKAAETVLNELLVAHEKYLPQFKETIEKLHQRGINPHDAKVRQLLAEHK
jgi:6-phospho-beta-glucosidase